MFANPKIRESFLWVIAIGIAAAVIGLPLINKKVVDKKEEVCVGNCPPPGPLDCTIYGRKKDGTWPSGYECASTP